MYKRSAEREAIDRAIRLTPTAVSVPAGATPPPPPSPTPTPVTAGPPRAEYETLAPARESRGMRLEPVADNGLPISGMWRASFVVADMNGDGIPDIVAPPSRMSDDAKPHVWIGNGKGSFSSWPLQFSENGKPSPEFAIGYGAVAVGDIDGDGRPDIVTASHGGGLISLFGEGGGKFRIVRTGLPDHDFSSQAITLMDADGDGKLDIVASADTLLGATNYTHVRVYLYRGAKGWEFKPDGIVGGFHSNSLHAWDYNKDGRPDLLTGSHLLEGLVLLWKNLGGGKFESVPIPEMDGYAYHFATVPGTFGKRRVPAFADSYYLVSPSQDLRTTTIMVYSFENGRWSRHPVWRKESGKSTQNALAMGDLDGDGLDDIVFADSEVNRLRVFFQKPDGSFSEMAEKDEPVLDSPGQCIQLADLDGDGRLDVVLSKTLSSDRLNDRGGWSVYLNKR